MICLQFRNTPFNMLKRPPVLITAQLHHIRQFRILHHLKFNCYLTQSSKCLNIEPHNLPRHSCTNNFLEFNVYLRSIDCKLSAITPRRA